MLANTKIGINNSTFMIGLPMMVNHKTILLQSTLIR